MGQTSRRANSSSRKDILDKCLINIIIKDCQPVSIVEDVGFREMLQVLEPSYAIPSRKALKEMIAKKYDEEKQNMKAKLLTTTAISLTADMCTSINMDAYLAVTGHFIADTKLCTTVLGVTRSVINDWGISEKVRCLVTDGGRT
ncbi:hypothetical protein WMY93_006454 [Mugilogobius chulae]|uniref:Uncharacterized protein n=1 Tax=Mugilogobius chulae TaxID=88201 RepID=A0AAW0PN91_9GOBI